jgi:hypothetical protein
VTLREHLKSFSESRVPILACALLILAALGVGRFGGPRVIERTTHHETETKLQTINTVQKVDVSELLKLVQESFAKLQKNIKVDTTTVRQADGTVTTHTVATDNSTAESGSKSTTDASRTTTATTATTNTLLDKKLTVDEKFKGPASSGPSWTVGAFATYQPFFSPPGFNLIPNQRLTVGAIVSHRLFGPVWGGGVLTSQAALGLELHWGW